MAARSITYGGWNWDKTITGFQKELLGNKDKLNKSAAQILYAGQQEFIKSLPSHEEPSMPFITGNLHDSIVAVISHSGRVLRAAYTDPVATQPSETTGKTIYRPTSGMGRQRIIGEVYARNAVRNLQGKYPVGIAATLMVTVPYAENPNEVSDTNKSGRHAGYVDILAYKYYKKMERAFSLYDKYNDFRWKKGPLTWETPILNK